MPTPPTINNTPPDPTIITNPVSAIVNEDEEKAITLDNGGYTKLQSPPPPPKLIDAEPPTLHKFLNPNDYYSFDFTASFQAPNNGPPPFNLANINNNSNNNAVIKPPPFNPPNANNNGPLPFNPPNNNGPPPFNPPTNNGPPPFNPPTNNGPPPPPDDVKDDAKTPETLTEAQQKLGDYFKDLQQQGQQADAELEDADIAFDKIDKIKGLNDVLEQANEIELIQKNLNKNLYDKTVAKQLQEKIDTIKHHLDNPLVKKYEQLAVDSFAVMAMGAPDASNYGSSPESAKEFASDVRDYADELTRIRNLIKQFPQDLETLQELKNHFENPQLDAQLIQLKQEVADRLTKSGKNPLLGAILGGAKLKSSKAHKKLLPKPQSHDNMISNKVKAMGKYLNSSPSPSPPPENDQDKDDWEI
jgi:hypothetical protein